MSAPGELSSNANTDSPLDALDAVLNLEEGFYAEGFALGETDGVQAGLVEGRAMGLQRGFDRFAAMGRLHGRSVVWHSRLGKPSPSEDTEARTDDSTETAPAGTSQRFMAPARIDSAANGAEQELMQRLDAVRWIPMRQNPRLRKHVQLLYGLSEPESLSVENKEDEVAEFDDRFRRASAKASIIGKIVGEPVTSEAAQGAGGSDEGLDRGTNKTGRTEVGIEDVDILKVRH